MMLPDLLKKFKQYAATLAFLVHYKLTGQNRITPSKKVLFLDISQNTFTRYLYLFIEFFYLEGYAIYLPFRLKLLNGIKNDHYASLLFRNKIIRLGKPAHHSQNLVIDDEVLSADYFSGRDTEGPDATFFVPMTQHPIMYHAGFWNAPVENTRRKRSVFMAGNFDPAAYKELENDGLFNVMSRGTVFSFLDQHNMLFTIKDSSELSKFRASTEDGKIILVNRLVFDIPIHGLRQVLAGFDFFFALPGVVMPLAHNIIEAMSVGTIPFIQEEYAKLFHPELADRVNAIIFRNNDDLRERLIQALQISNEELLLLRRKVVDYYNDHLTPESVVKKIENGNFVTIFLQGEHYSVALQKKRKPRRFE